MPVLPYIALLGGIIVLLFSSSLLGGTTASLAQKLRVSKRIVGITILSLATTLPEIMLAINATARNAATMAVGAAIGSSLANLLLIVGVLAVIKPLTVRKGTTGIAFPLAFAGTLSFLLLGMDTVFGMDSRNVLSLSDGLVLLAIVGLFVYFFVYNAKNHPECYSMEEGAKPESESWSRIILSMALSTAGLVAGSYIAVEGAIEVTRIHGLAQETMGVVILAIYVALPEIAVAFSMRHSDERELVFGNLLGASFYNLTLVPGIACLISPLPLYANALADLIILLVGLLLLLIFVAQHGSRVVTRVEGALLLGFYFVVILYSILGTTSAVRVLF